MADEIMLGAALTALRSGCGLSPAHLSRRLHLPLSTILGSAHQTEKIVR